LIRNKKQNWVEHILRGDGIVTDVIERSKEKISRGRPETGVLHDLNVDSLS